MLDPKPIELSAAHVRCLQGLASQLRQLCLDGYYIFEEDGALEQLSLLTNLQALDLAHDTYNMSSIASLEHLPLEWLQLHVPSKDELQELPSHLSVACLKSKRRVFDDLGSSELVPLNSWNVSAHDQLLIYYTRARPVL